MNKNALKSYAVWARQKLINDVAQKHLNTQSQRTVSVKKMRKQSESVHFQTTKSSKEVNL